MCCMRRKAEEDNISSSSITYSSEMGAGPRFLFRGGETFSLASIVAFSVAFSWGFSSPIHLSLTSLTRTDEFSFQDPRLCLHKLLIPPRPGRALSPINNHLILRLLTPLVKLAFSFYGGQLRQCLRCRRFFWQRRTKVATVLLQQISSSRLAKTGR
jgi:hypothetical protein